MVELASDLFQSIADKRKLTEGQKRAAAELILLNPDLLIAQYKNSQGLSSEAENYANLGNTLVAENRFATALKLALYENDLDSAKRYLERCLSVDQTNNLAYKLTQDNFELVSECVIEFYKAESGSGG